MWFLPRTVGAAPVRTQPEMFVRAFARRIETGLLGPSRSHYAITRLERDGLAFRATDWPTALSVGLNDVELTVSAGQARYAIRYRRWAAYGVALGAVIGVGLAVIFLALDIRDYIDRDVLWMIPGLNADQNVAIAWSMVAFISEVDQSAQTLSVR
jgi:hypothetical protein